MVLLTYLCQLFQVEHRPSTTPHHRTLFWAALAIPDQLAPCCFSSASVSRLQLLRGRPLFLFPFGLQVRAWRAGCWLPEGVSNPAPLPPQYQLGHRSSCWIFPYHRMLQIHLAQVLKNVRIFCCIVCVVRHVSLPYSRIDFTLELKTRSLVLMLIPPDAQMLLNTTKAALALPILAVTSRPVPPC